MVRPAISQERFDEFFDRALAAQARAEATAASSTCRRFLIAGRVIEFRLAHPALARLFCEALAHIEVDLVGDSDFTFHIWDETSSGVSAPSLGVFDETDLAGHPEITAFIGSDRYLQVAHGRAMVSAASRSARRAVVWLRTHSHGPEWECGSPLVTLINWWASEFGYFAVHAGAVGHSEGGVLIVGRSGAGKSHTSIACLESDLFYLGDDHCLLGTNDRPIVSSLYSTAKLFATDLYRFPTLEKRESEAIHTPENKAVFFLKDIMPNRLATDFPLRAILLPTHSGGRDTRVEPASPAAALLAMGPYNILRWPSFGRTPLARFANILRSLPCFRIETGTDMAQIPGTIASLLDRVQPREMV